MKKIGIISLGCSKNRVDTEMMLGELVSKHYLITNNAEEADVLVVNTCGFIDSAKKESLDTIQELAEYKKHGSCQQLVVMGCLVQRYGKNLLNEIPQIDLLAGSGDYPAVVNFLTQPTLPSLKKSSEKSILKKPTFYYNSPSDRVLTTPFYSAYVKIAEGCSSKCSYCIIPKLRGPLVSRPKPSINKEVQSLAKRGVLEYNLIAQNTTLYGKDLKMNEGLHSLLLDLTAIPDVRWIRILYSHSSCVTSHLLSLFKKEEKLCNYFDIPLQHSHNQILKKMRRTDSEETIRNSIDLIRQTLPDAAIRTTFIVGFPGETKKHFKHLCSFIKEIEFDHLGVFSYSQEEGTPAARLPDTVPQELKEERFQEIMQLQQSISKRNNKKKIGIIYPVLIEGPSETDQNIFIGRMQSQAPEVDGIVYLTTNDPALTGTIARVKIIKAMEYDLVGELVK